MQRKITTKQRGGFVMGKLQDIIGEKFGRLTVTKFSHMDKGGNSFWDCLCTCGKSKSINRSHLKKGYTKSCGCIHIERSTKHNLCESSTYHIWSHMIQRCTNENTEFFHRYGGRGITVCNKWLTFEGFLEDMGERPKGLSIDRKDNNQGYYKDNCRWATLKEQANNNSRNHLITYNNKTQNIEQWSKELGMNRGTLWSRLVTYRWSVEKAITTPIRLSKK